MDKFKVLISSDKSVTVLSSLICVLLGLLVGLVFLLICNPGYGFQGFGEVISGAFALPSSTGEAIANVGPLILVGLSVTFAYKCGLFNIGVAGQYLFGILGCLSTALIFEWHWIFCLLAGGLLGGLWGVIPGLLKTYFNINEVIASIMTNWIALFAVNELIINSSKMYDLNRTSTYYVYGFSKLPDWFNLSSMFETQSLTIAIFIAIIIAIAVHVVLNKTKIGFELTACGLNKDAAKYAGVNYKKNVVMAMGIAGVLAGMAASLYYLSNVGQYNPNNSASLPAMGFDGISVSLIGALNPIGGIFSSFLMAFLSRGSSTINPNYFPPEVANLIFGIIIYLCAFSAFFRTKVVKLLSRFKPVDNNANSDSEVKQDNPVEDKVSTKEVDVK